MKADFIINNIKTLYTPYHIPPVHGEKMNDILTIHNAYIAIKDGKVLSIGKGLGNAFIGSSTTIKDGEAKIVVPGFIDSHTHLVHAGSREDEYEDLKRGIPYLDILNRGGGILGTVEKTRSATVNDLVNQATISLDKMLQFGVTTIESKSGYGLNYETEEKQLKVNQHLNKIHPVNIISTYMGAHAYPKEYLHNKKGYIKSIVDDLKRFKGKGLFEAVDVFCEEGVFSLEETKEILLEAKGLGYTTKLHADEIVSLGGAGLGVDLGCTSVDHLMAIRDEDILKLAYSNTVANLLPGTSFYLKKGYAKARKMIDSGVAVSIAGDYNPGSCPTENFALIMSLASNYLQMTAKEILTAVTINPSYHLGIHHEKGSLQEGKDADFLILDAPNFEYTVYHFGINHVKDVYIKGIQVVKNQEIVRKNT